MGTGKKIGIAIAVIVVAVFAIGQKILIDAHKELDERQVLTQSGAVATCRH